MAQFLVAASDGVLAVAGVVGVAQLRRAPLSSALRWAAAVGIALIGAAAALGVLRFSGAEATLPLHQFLSDQSAILGMPVLALVLFAQRVGATSSIGSVRARAVAAGLAALVIVITVMQQRLPAAALSLGMLVALIAWQPRRASGPGLLLAGLIVAGVVRTWNAVALEPRLIGLHLILAVWLGAYVYTLRNEPVQQT